MKIAIWVWYGSGMGLIWVEADRGWRFRVKSLKRFDIVAISNVRPCLGGATRLGKTQIRRGWGADGFDGTTGHRLLCGGFDGCF